MTLTLLHIELKHNVWAYSPSFPVQQIVDPYNDLNAQSNSTSYQIPAETVICNAYGFDDPTDIIASNYYSDGKYLYATLWLAYPLVDPPSNLTSREYGFQVDVKSVRDERTADYASDIIWKNNSWMKELVEYSPVTDDRRHIEIKPNQTGFLQEGNNYISVMLDLETINSPEEYRVLFYSFDTFKKNEDVYCEFLDTTAYYPVPPPEYNITASQNSLFLKKGQEKTIELRMKSDANFNSFAHISDKPIKGLEVDLKPAELSLPPNGITTSLVRIKALEDATIGSYTLSINSSVTIDEPLYMGYTELIKDPVAPTPGGNIDLTVTVEEPLGVLDYINSALNTWGAPVKEFFAIVTTIGGAGISGWIINKVRKNRRKKEDANTNSHNVTGSTSPMETKQNHS